MRFVSKTAVLSLVAATSIFAAGSAIAAGSHSGGHSAGQPTGHPSDGHHAGTEAIGAPGNAAEVDRTIEIVMGDNFFEPDVLTVRPGETIRFVVKNDGDFLHEFNLGTAAMHAAHQQEMVTMMEDGRMTPTGMNPEAMAKHAGAMAAGGGHDDPNSLLLAPGESGEMIWRFAAATELEFACNVPGHYEAGMRGRVEFHKGPKAGS